MGTTMMKTNRHRLYLFAAAFVLQMGIGSVTAQQTGPAQSTPSQPAASTQPSARKPGMPSAAETLIDLIPDDAVVMLQIERPQRVLPPKLIEPFFGALADNKTTAAAWVEAVKRIPGPLVIGFFAPPPDKDLSDFFIFMGLTGPGVDAHDLIEKSFLPAVQATARDESGLTLKFRKDGEIGRLLDPNDVPVFAYAVKGKVAFGSTKVQLTSRWLHGDWPKSRWVAEPGVRRMVGRLPKEFSARVLVNPVPLVAQLRKPAPNSLEELAMKVFAPADFQAAAVDLTWGMEIISLRATVALADECHGLVRVLARPTTPARVLGVFPEDFVAVGRIGWNSAADLVDGIYAVTDEFDETISAEYREELAEFKKETGVDWDQGIIGNLVGELAFGVRLDFTRKNPIGWSVVFPLGDEAGFREQFDKLTAYFDLQFEDTEKDGVVVRKTKVAKGEPPRDVQLPPAASFLSEGFYLALDHGLLITGSNAEIVADVAKQAAAGKQPLPAAPNLRACYTVLGDPNHMALMLDIEQLKNKAPFVPLAAGPLMGPLLTRGFVGLSASVHEHVAKVDFLWSLRNAAGKQPEAKTSAPAPIDTDEAIASLIKTMGASIANARRQAQQTLAAATMRNIGQALQLYAQEHKGAFPESLEALLRAQPDLLSPKTLTSPYSGKGPKSLDEVKAKSWFVYRAGLNATSKADEVVLGEREVHDGGANFLFVDGHVEFIPEPRATELLKVIAGEGPQGGQ
jgi:prepilin-type processing-associated H-X9-DG protein